MKNILLAVGLLVGGIGVANAEIKEKAVPHYFVEGEIPQDVINNYNAAQMSLNKSRNKILNELNAENPKGAAIDMKKAYQLSCVQLMPIMNALMQNDEYLLKHIKSEKSSQQLKSTMAQNTQVLNLMNQQCDHLRNNM